MACLSILQVTGQLPNASQGCIQVDQSGAGRLADILACFMLHACIECPTLALFLSLYPECLLLSNNVMGTPAAAKFLSSFDEQVDISH